MTDGGRDGRSGGQYNGKMGRGTKREWDGRRVGRRDGGMEGRRDGGTEGRTDGQTEGRTDGRTEGGTEGGTGGRKDWQRDRARDGQ